MPGLERAERDVGETLEMQVENAKVERLLDQLHALVDEMPLVAHEGEQHADGHAVVERKPRAEIDGDDVLDAEQNVVDRLEADLEAAEANVRVHSVGIAIEPLPL